jgi:hypothetical protein
LFALGHFPPEQWGILAPLEGATQGVLGDITAEADVAVSVAVGVSVGVVVPPPVSEGSGLAEGLLGEPPVGFGFVDVGVTGRDVTGCVADGKPAVGVDAGAEVEEPVPAPPAAPAEDAVAGPDADGDAEAEPDADADALAVAVAETDALASAGGVPVSSETDDGVLDGLTSPSCAGLPKAETPKATAPPSAPIRATPATAVVI